MLPRYLPLVLISVSSVFFAKAQDKEKFIPFSKNLYTAWQSRLISSRGNNAGGPSTNKDTVPGSCICSVTPQIVPAGKQANTRTYQGIPNASCTSVPFTEPLPGLSGSAAYLKHFDTCSVSNITWSWSISAGNNIAAINGNTTGSTVDVTVSGTGSYTLSLVNAVTCSSGSSCSNSTEYTDTAQVDSSHCTCTAGPVTIQPTNKQGSVWTYQGSVEGNCTGQYGLPPNLSNCAVQNTTYQWSILAPGGVASIAGNNDGSTVNIAINGNGPFTLRLDGTTTCSDGQSCTNYNFYFDTAKVETPKHCDCNVQNAAIQNLNKNAPLFTYQAVVNGQCTGQYGTPPNLLTCGVQNITYNWFISSGNGVAEISGNDQGPTVDVKIKGSGAFTLNVFGDVTCNEGNKCHYETYINDSSSSKQGCNISVEEIVEPKMDGGLQQKYTGTHKVKRDGFIVLGAEGKDYDQVKFTCTPSSDCKESGSDKTVVLNSRVRFEWAITGDGNFVKLGGLPENVKSDKGDNVVFQPPYVPLPETGNESSVTTTVKLSIIDDNPTQPIDPTVEKTITIITKRFKNEPDAYTIVVQSAAFTLPGIPTGGGKPGDCNAAGPTWEQKNDLVKPEIELPDVADKDKMVVGEWIVLDAKDQRDGDRLKMVCDSKTCDGDGYQKVYEDNVDWDWTIAPGQGNGRFVSSPKGRYVVYEAPLKLPDNKDVTEVKIHVKVRNPDGLKVADVVPPEGEITLKIYRAGVKVDYPPSDWLPQENNQVSIKSFLVYRNGGKWLPGLAHQSRIHFFELMHVSTEKGVCLNDPVPKEADECHDLFIDKGQDHEAFNDKKVNNCTVTELFMEARTKKPVKEYSLPINSRDFGSYGFLRTEATTKDKVPFYESVPVLKSDVTHPAGRPKKQEYADNRINIPRDIDENRIADGGWTVAGVAIGDPADNKADDDNTPAGDNFNGDGLTAYEEYRGFRVLENGASVHIRTNPGVKDLFVHNPDALPLNLFRQQSNLPVHEISVEQYGSDATRFINFNFNGATHTVEQKGLHLVNGGDNTALLGIALGANKEPAPPNWVEKVIIYKDRITTFCGRPRNLNINTKLAQVTAHELAHACNVYHHGEGDPSVENDYQKIHGLRSGNVSCIMRYDNIDSGHPETIGSLFCPSATGTGGNANNKGFQDANTDLCRGNCLGQFRVSGRQAQYPKRVTHGDCQRIKRG